MKIMFSKTEPNNEFYIIIDGSGYLVTDIIFETLDEVDEYFIDTFSTYGIDDDISDFAIIPLTAPAIKITGIEF